MPAHPLDPLSPDELAAAIEIIRREQNLNQNHLFVFTLLDEPAKDILAAWKPGDPIDRAARITIWDRAEGLLIESVVGLDGTIRRWEPQPGQKAALLGPEAAACIAAAKSDPRVLEGLRKRGIDDVSQIHMETWPFGIDVPEHLDDGRRLFWTPMWYRPTPDANQYMTIALGSAQAVAGVVTQGRANGFQWVLTYQVQTSQDCSSYVYVECGRVFTGNTDQTTSAQAVFAAPVQASCVRLLPETWSGHISMRAAVLLATSGTPATIPAGWPQDCDALLDLTS